MYINRVLLLMAGLLVIFYPTLEDWMFGEQGAWYRPYLLWLLAIAAAYWNQRRRPMDEL